MIEISYEAIDVAIKLMRLNETHALRVEGRDLEVAKLKRLFPDIGITFAEPMRFLGIPVVIEPLRPAGWVFIVMSDGELIGIDMRGDPK